MLACHTLLVCVLVIPKDALATWMVNSATQTPAERTQDEFDTRPTLLIPRKENVSFKSLENMTIHVLLHEMSPYTQVFEDSDGALLTGYIGEMWVALETKLAFRSEYRKVTFSEGKETLKTGNADIMLSPVVVEAKDVDLFSAVGPVATSVYSLYMRATDDHGSSLSYLWTWSRDLWLSYFGVLVLCTLLLWTMSNIRRHFGLDLKIPRKGVVQQKTTDTEGQLSLGNCFLFILGAATQQDVQIRTKVCSLRVMLVVLLIFNSLMSTSYTSVLVSRLTVGHSNYRFDSLQSILDSNSLFLCVRTNSAVYSMFKANDSSKELHPMWESVVNKGPCHPDPRTTGDIALNICKERSVVFESDNIMSGLLANVNECDTVRLRFKRIFSQISILFRKDYEYISIFKFEIMKMKESGVLQLLEDRFLYVKGKFPTAQTYQAVTISHVRALVFVYGGAIAFSFLLLILELSVHFKPSTPSTFIGAASKSLNKR